MNGCAGPADNGAEGSRLVRDGAAALRAFAAEAEDIARLRRSLEERSRQFEASEAFDPDRLMAEGDAAASQPHLQWWILGRVFERRRQFDRAAEAFGRAARDPAVPAFCAASYMRCLYQIGRAREGLEFAASLPARQRADPECALALVDLLRAASRVDEAIDILAALHRQALLPPARSNLLVDLLIHAAQFERLGAFLVEDIASGRRAVSGARIAMALRNPIGETERARILAGLGTAQMHPRLSQVMVGLEDGVADEDDQRVERRLVVRGARFPTEVRHLFDGTGHPHEARYRRERLGPDIELLSLRDAVLAILPTGFMVLDAQLRPTRLANPRPVGSAIEAAAELPVIGSFDTLFLASDGLKYSGNYFHWMIDHLPRILWGRRLCPDLPIGLCHLRLDGFRKQSLDWYGVDCERLHVLASGLYRVGHLALLSTSLPASRHGLHDGNLDYGAPLLDPLPVTLAAERRRRLYVCREPGQGRSFVNHAEIDAIAASFGFEKVDPGRHPFDRQIAMFAEASHVFGPHGAALTNIICCARGTRVLEVYPGAHGSIAYPVLSNLRGLNHRVLVAGPHRYPLIASNDWHTADVYLDPGLLSGALAEIP